MPYEFHTKRKMEFYDTDMAGIVHFARFFIFMETAEHEFFRSLGTSGILELDGMSIGWPRLSVSCEYLKSVRFEDELDIHLSVLKKGEKTITYGFVFTKDDVTIARGQSTAACCINDPTEGFKAIRIPEFIADKIQEAPGSQSKINRK